VSLKEPAKHRISTKVWGHRYGQGKWEDYLLDQQQITYDAARETISRQDAILSTLRSNTAAGEAAWSDVAASIDNMAQGLEYQLSLVADQMEMHTELLTSVDKKLSRIVKLLRNPQATAAEEYFRAGRAMWEKRLLTESLTHFHKAEEAWPVNPALHWYLGLIYMEGVEAGVALVNYELCERHLGLAVRYAEAYRTELDAVSGGFMELIFRSRARLDFIRASDARSEGDLDKERQLLLASRSWVLRILDPARDTRFLAASVEALLGNGAEAATWLLPLADEDRATIPLALSFPDLESAADEINAITSRLAESPGPHTASLRALVDRIEELARECASIQDPRLTILAQTAVEESRVVWQQFLAGAVNVHEGKEQAVLISKGLCKAAVKVLDERLAPMQAQLDAIDRERRTHHSVAAKEYRFEIPKAWYWVVGIIFITVMAGMEGRRPSPSQTASIIAAFVFGPVLLFSWPTMAYLAHRMTQKDAIADIDAGEKRFEAAAKPMTQVHVQRARLSQYM
jgi:hypothetical protein